MSAYSPDDAIKPHPVKGNMWADPSVALSKDFIDLFFYVLDG